MVQDELDTFSGILFREKIRKFRDISEQFEQLTRAEIYARLAARIPSLTQEASQSSEIGMLQRAIRNNGHGLAIRETARLFGYARAGANVESSMMEGIQMCISRNLAKHEDGRIMII